MAGRFYLWISAVWTSMNVSAVFQLSRLLWRCYVDNGEIIN